MELEEELDGQTREEEEGEGFGSEERDDETPRDAEPEEGTG